MRWAVLGVGAVFFGAPSGMAQEFVGEVGACLIETSRGELVNWNSCKRMPPKCTSARCETEFLWQQGGDTVITLPTAQSSVADGTAMNGQDAYAPAALRDSDPRDCIYNSVSDAVFCWVPGVEAFTIAAGGLGNPAELRTVARMNRQSEVSSDASGEAAGAQGLLARLQGRYIPFPTWDCNVLGGEGGAMQIKGDVFYGVESACQLKNGRPVGTHGAGLFDVTCEGEGETWEDEYILRRDEWGTLAWMSADQVSTLESCD